MPVGRVAREEDSHPATCRKDMMLAVPVVVPTAEVAMMQAAKALQDLLPYPPLSAL